ncbi:hypothetical protein PUN28_009700 [Cardiocondyla obscurior]|uniref:C2H2-type domain-containing protein n=1 Tax=Cardiocondyla obscurior TaxID=286306 RepID=A0AAW2FW12_9HYME
MKRQGTHGDFRPASSRIRSCRSSDCNHHHLSKSICKAHMYVHMIRSNSLLNGNRFRRYCQYHLPLSNQNLNVKQRAS